MPSTLGARPTAGLAPLAIALEVDDLAVGCRLDLEHLDSKLQLDTIVDHGPLDDLSGVGVLTYQNVRRHIEKRHLTAKTGEGLGYLAADGAGTNHTKPTGQSGEREDGLIGQITAFVTSADWWGDRACAGGDDGTSKSQSLARDLNRISSDESTLPQEDVYP
jgi:hypothetical protein